MASSSTTPPPPPPQRKYDVFLSFRGEETRKNFVGHLYNALFREGFLTFKDDEQLQRGKEISPELLKAIEESRLSVIIFSKNYASSSWCLDELVKILECKNLMGQIVVPVFYKVDPSDLRTQTGSFAAAFTKHEKDYYYYYGRGGIEKVQKWRDALREAASISGWDTETTADGHESKCIQEIVKDIFNKLGNTISSAVEDLVGIDSRVEEVCSLLGPRLDDVRVIGIWGMGGIGKTTIAKSVYNRISHQFEDGSFLAVRELLEKHGREALRQQLFSIVSRLRCKRVLVVLDDVDQISELEVLPRKYDWVSSGSRIIITTRDARFLITHGVDVRYEVKALDKNEALQLFSSKAFKQSYAPEDYVKLSDDVVCYAAGLPLALKVLGSSLFGRNQNEWKSTLSRLKKIPNKNILQVLKISFDELDELDQQIFLDIACFFNGKERDFVTRILDGCDFDPDIGISVLIEKSLITVNEENMLQMHALIQKLGWYIVHQEDPKEPGRRSRLWIPEDVCHVLRENTATNAVEGIIWDYNNIPKNEDFEAFKKMHNLRLLKFHHTLLSRGPECLPNKLSWLDWHGYPSKSLPASFKAEKLVELCMHYSCIIELWKGKKILEKLISIDLSHSQKLRMTPDFTGLPNLRRLILKGCTSLVQVHPSIGFHQRLILLNLTNCRKLKSLPNSFELESLKTLILSDCSKLEKFPEIMNMECLSELYLDGTAIKELPSSIEQLNNLVLINLKGCRKLTSLPDSICKLKCLKTIDLSGCTKLEELPQNFRDMECLEELYADETAIKQLSSSIALLNNLKIFSICGYKGTTSQSLSSVFSSWLLQKESQISMSLVLHAVSGLRSLTKLDISRCNLFDWQIPSDLGCLLSLEELNLSRNNFVNISASINQLSQLKILWLVECKRLEALPELPASLVQLYGDDCTSLIVSNPKNEYKFLKSVSFSGCSKLLEHNRSGNLVDISLKHMLQFALKDKGFSDPHRFSGILPGSEIPEWFTHQNMGNSISVKLPSRWYNDKFKAFAICVVSEFLSAPSCLEDVLSYAIRLKLKTRDHQEYILITTMYNRGNRSLVKSEHVCLGYILANELCSESSRIGRNNWCQLEVSVGIHKNDDILPRGLVAKKVGCRLVYEEEA